MPSEASVKFFDETFFQKSFDLALDFSGRQPEKKLGKQRSVFPGRWGTKKVASRKLGSKASFCPLSRLTAPAPPRGEPSLASPFGGGAPAGGGEGEVPAAPSHGLRGSAGTLPTPLTNAAERGTIEIEKESLPVRRLAQVMKLLYEKVADSLDGGGYFFVS